MSYIKSPLRYPGGKSLFVKKIAPLIGEFQEYREPFAGGSSVFFHERQLFPSKKFWINDIFHDLYVFWKCAKEDNERLCNAIRIYKKINVDLEKAYHFIREHNGSFSDFEKAVMFFVINRISFSGVAFSGGFSEESSKRRFTDSCIDRVSLVGPLLSGVKITNLDYEEMVNAEPDGCDAKEVVIYLDPPYKSAVKSKLYGKNGDVHRGFDHVRFAEVMKKCRYRFVISYDDSEEVRNFFSFANLNEIQMHYGSKLGKGEHRIGKELLITNF